VFGKHPAWRDFIDPAVLPPIPAALRLFHSTFRPGVEVAFSDARRHACLLAFGNRSSSVIVLVVPSGDSAGRRSPLMIGVAALMPFDRLLYFAGERMLALSDSLRGSIDQSSFTARRRDAAATWVPEFQLVDETLTARDWEIAQARRRCRRERLNRWLGRSGPAAAGGAGEAKTSAEAGTIPAPTESTPPRAADGYALFTQPAELVRAAAPLRRFMRRIRVAAASSSRQSTLARWLRDLWHDRFHRRAGAGRMILVPSECDDLLSGAKAWAATLTGHKLDTRPIALAVSASPQAHAVLFRRATPKHAPTLCDALRWRGGGDPRRPEHASPTA
jgi:hypothetical protein